MNQVLDQVLNRELFSLLWPSLLSYVLWRGTALLLISFALAFLVRRQPALRHRLGVLTFGGLLLLPLLCYAPRVTTVYLDPQPTPTPLGTVARMDGHPAHSLSSPVLAPQSIPPQSLEKQMAEAPDIAPQLRGLAQPIEDPPLFSPAQWRRFMVSSLLGIWLLGAVCVMLRALRSYAALRRLEKVAALEHHAEFLSEQCAQLSAEMGVRRPVALRIAESEDITVPMTWGWRKPTVLLPSASLDWSGEQRRSALLHELSHVQRGDWAAQCLATLVCALYWFHPLVWLAAARLKADAERATDEQVVAAGVKASDYCAHLLALARAATLGATHSYTRCAVPMARHAHLERRLRPLLQAVPARRGLRVTRFVVTGALGLAFVTMATSQFAARAVSPTASRKAALANKYSSGDSWDTRTTGTKRQIAAAEHQFRAAQQQLNKVNAQAHAQARANGGVQTEATKAQVADAEDRVNQASARITRLAAQEAMRQLEIEESGDALGGLFNSYGITATYGARLDDFTTVSLLAVTDPLAGNGQWWTPKGQLLPRNAFKASTDTKVTPGHKLRQFIVRIHRAHPNEEDWGWSSDPYPTSSGAAFYDKWKPPYAGNGQIVNFTSLIPEGRTKSNFNMFVTFKPWHTVAESRQDTASSHTERRYQVSFAAGVEIAHGKNALIKADGDIEVSNDKDPLLPDPNYKGADASITVSHNIFDQDVRVVAVDVQGREHLAWLSYSTKNPSFRQLTCTYKGLPLSSVRAFRLQVQPVCTITFPNIPLDAPVTVAPQPASARRAGSLTPIAWNTIAPGVRFGIGAGKGTISTKEEVPISLYLDVSQSDSGASLALKPLSTDWDNLLVNLSGYPQPRNGSAIFRAVKRTVWKPTLQRGVYTALVRQVTIQPSGDWVLKAQLPMRVGQSVVTATTPQCHVMVK